MSDCSKCIKNLKNPDNSRLLNSIEETRLDNVQLVMCGDCPVDGPWKEIEGK